MAALVVDRSVVINWLIPQTYTPQALKLLKQYQEGQWEFLAPNHIHSEVGNAIWRLQRANMINVTDAKNALIKFLAHPFRSVSGADLLLDAHVIAIQYNRSVYDSLYIALAQRENCSFVTADEKLVNAVGGSYQ